MFLQINKIAKTYGDKQVLQEINLSLPFYTTMSILGKSGCGKSTLLKIIAGLEQQDSGEILLQNKNISTTPAHERSIVYLFQEAMLFPHLTIAANLAFGLKVRKMDKEIITEKVAAILKALDLEAHAKKMPHQLSGGQKQRVAFGRALIVNPPLILLDEPFSSLDVETRASMQALYKKIAKEFEITALFITHDLKEALIMGDQIAYMEGGVLQVYDKKEDFIHDQKTGVLEEMDFWKELG